MVKHDIGLQTLRAYVKRHTTQRAASKALGISAPYLCDLLRGRRSLSDRLLAKLSLKRSVVKVERGA